MHLRIDNSILCFFLTYRRYASFVEELKAHNGSTTLETRKKLAATAFAATAAYDTAIAEWFNAQNNAQTQPAAAAAAPQTVTYDTYLGIFMLRCPRLLLCFASSCGNLIV